MWRVVTDMTNTFAVQARTALSPEWDHGFDEAFTDLVTADPDWVHDEFDALIGANFHEPPEPPAPSAEPTGQSEPPPSPGDNGKIRPSPTADDHPADTVIKQRSPP
jgi:hypothetical protein